MEDSVIIGGIFLAIAACMQAYRMGFRKGWRDGAHSATKKAIKRILRDAGISDEKIAQLQDSQP